MKGSGGGLGGSSSSARHDEACLPASRTADDMKPATLGAHLNFQRTLRHVTPLGQLPFCLELHFSAASEIIDPVKKAVPMKTSPRTVRMMYSPDIRKPDIRRRDIPARKKNAKAAAAPLRASVFMVVDLV